MRPLQKGDTANALASTSSTVPKPRKTNNSANYFDLNDLIDAGNANRAAKRLRLSPPPERPTSSGSASADSSTASARKKGKRRQLPRIDDEPEDELQDVFDNEVSSDEEAPLAATSTARVPNRSPTQPPPPSPPEEVEPVRRSAEIARARPQLVLETDDDMDDDGGYEPPDQVDELSQDPPPRAKTKSGGGLFSRESSSNASDSSDDPLAIQTELVHKPYPSPLRTIKELPSGRAGREEAERKAAEQKRALEEANRIIEARRQREAEEEARMAAQSAVVEMDEIESSSSDDEPLASAAVRSQPAAPPTRTAIRPSAPSATAPASSSSKIGMSALSGLKFNRVSAAAVPSSSAPPQAPARASQQNPPPPSASRPISQYQPPPPRPQVVAPSQYQHPPSRPAPPQSALPPPPTSAPPPLPPPPAPVVETPTMDPRRRRLQTPVTTSTPADPPAPMPAPPPAVTHRPAPPPPAVVAARVRLSEEKLAGELRQSVLYSKLPTGTSVLGDKIRSHWSVHSVAQTMQPFDSLVGGKRVFIYAGEQDDSIRSGVPGVASRAREIKADLIALQLVLSTVQGVTVWDGRTPEIEVVFVHARAAKAKEGSPAVLERLRTNRGEVVAFLFGETDVEHTAVDGKKSVVKDRSLKRFWTSSKHPLLRESALTMACFADS